MSIFNRFKKDKNTQETVLVCKQVAEDLQSYLDNEDTIENRDMIAAHLQACRDCGLEADTFNQIKASLARPVLEIDDSALERLRAFGASITQEAANDLNDESPN